MKIAMIGHKRIPGREGGVEVVVEELSRRLVTLGNEVTVYNRKKKGALSYKKYDGVKIITIPTIERKSLNAAIYCLIASVNVSFKHFDVIHYHALGPAAFLLIPKLFGNKIVVTVHGLNYKTPKWHGFASKFIKFGEGVAAKYADEIIVLSHVMQQYFLEQYGRKTRYIPNGVIPLQREDANYIIAQYGLAKDSYLLYASRIVPGKGLEYLIKAFKEVPTEKKLVIAGSGEYVDEYMSYISRLAEGDDRVIFTGFVEGKVLDELYSNAYLYIFPSEAEGMPISLLEAMSCNCPCLVSDIPENLEVIRNDGWTFVSGSISSLKSELIEILSLDSIHMETRSRVIREYNWDEIAKKTMKVYTELYENGNSNER